MRFLILSEYFCFNAESLQPDFSGTLFVKQKAEGINVRKVKAILEVLSCPKIKRKLSGNCL